jgi:hypothetical protein
VIQGRAQSGERRAQLMGDRLAEVLRLSHQPLHLVHHDVDDAGEIVKFVVAVVPGQSQGEIAGRDRFAGGLNRFYATQRPGAQEDRQREPHCDGQAAAPHDGAQNNVLNLAQLAGVAARHQHLSPRQTFGQGALGGERFAGRDIAGQAVQRQVLRRQKGIARHKPPVG